ncbi:MAG: VTT domain-containing protein [Gammaproteobacteria bacterium]
MNTTTRTGLAQLSRRLPIIIIGVMVAALLAYSEEIHQQVVRVIALVEPVIAAWPIAGALLFVLLAAVSAILVFFSSLLLVPLGIQAWGPLPCFLLLWSGWFLGGVVTYTIGRYLGRPAVRRMLTAGEIARYESHIPKVGSLATAALTQLMLPSDISGYFFGLFGYPARIYLGGLALAELPYALGTVYLGSAFVQRQYLLLLAAAALGIVILGIAWWRRR